MVVFDKKERSCKIIDFAVPGDSRIEENWLTYCGGTDRPGHNFFSGHKLRHNFSISDDLTQMINHSWNPPPPLPTHTHTHTTLIKVGGGGRTFQKLSHLGWEVQKFLLERGE